MSLSVCVSSRVTASIVVAAAAVVVIFIVVAGIKSKGRDWSNSRLAKA